MYLPTCLPLRRALRPIRALRSRIQMTTRAGIQSKCVFVSLACQNTSLVSSSFYSVCRRLFANFWLRNLMDDARAILAVIQGQLISVLFSCPATSG